MHRNLLRNFIYCNAKLLFQSLVESWSNISLPDVSFVSILRETNFLRNASSIRITLFCTLKILAIIVCEVLLAELHHFWPEDEPVPRFVVSKDMLTVTSCA